MLVIAVSEVFATQVHNKFCLTRDITLCTTSEQYLVPKFIVGKCQHEVGLRYSISSYSIHRCAAKGISVRIFATGKVHLRQPSGTAQHRRIK